MLKSCQGFKKGQGKLMKDYPPRTSDTNILLLAHTCELEKFKKNYHWQLGKYSG